MIKQDFINPGKEFTPIPFWFWNDELKQDTIRWQIEDFISKGINAFVIHPRIGLPKSLKYMSEEFMNYVEFAVECAKKHGSKVVLYDEGMYPSGSANGQVVEYNQEFASKCLVKTDSVLEDDKIIYHDDNFYYVQRFSRGTIRGIHYGEDDLEKDAPPSADLLNINAVKVFMNLTHNKYEKRLSKFFGDTIIGIFTDEPSIMGRCVAIKNAVPWSDDFLEYYEKCGGNVTDIPFFFLDNSSQKAFYECTVAKRMEETYYKPLFLWCEKQRISLMGHPSESMDIGMMKYFHIPGQDLVLRRVEPKSDISLFGADSTQAKCTSDAARHLGRRRNSNEVFGACNKNNIPWNFTGDDMKWYLDWLFVRGVNMIIPHAFYYSIAGQRAYERPPDVGPNNVWWDNYSTISTYIKRNAFIMTDSHNITDIAVLCLDNQLPSNSLLKLYENQVEFNYLQQSLILGNNIFKSRICIHDQEYSKVFIDKQLNISDECIKVLNEGKVTYTYDIDEVIAYYKGAKLKKADKNIRITHVVKEDLHFYLLVNEGEENSENEVVLDKVGSAELWNAWEGTIKKAIVTDISENSMTVAFILDRRESIIIVVDEKEEAELLTNEKPIINKRQTIGSYKEETHEALCQFFCDKKYDKVVLEIECAFELAEIWINNNHMVKMWAPYKYNITEHVNIGENTVKIKVTPSRVHDFAELKQTKGLKGEVFAEFYEKSPNILT